jgi:hypothetical protein
VTSELACPVGVGWKDVIVPRRHDLSSLPAHIVGRKTLIRPGSTVRGQANRTSLGGNRASEIELLVYASVI